MTIHIVNGKKIETRCEASECWSGCDDPHCPYIHKDWLPDGGRDRVGTGPTEEEAIRDCLEQIEEIGT